MKNVRPILWNLLPVIISLIFPLDVGAAFIAAFAMMALIFINLYYVNRLWVSVAVMSAAAVLSTIGLFVNIQVVGRLYTDEIIVDALGNYFITGYAIICAVSVLAFFIIETVFRHKTKT